MSSTDSAFGLVGKGVFFEMSGTVSGSLQSMTRTSFYVHINDAISV